MNRDTFLDDITGLGKEDKLVKRGFLDDLAGTEPTHEPGDVAPYNVIGGLKTIGGTILRVPENITAAALSAIKGKEGATVTKSDWMTDYIKEVDLRNKERTKNIEKEYGKEAQAAPYIKVTDVAELAPNIGFSGASMGGSVIGGTFGALTPVPGGMVLGGMAGGGAAAYRMDSHQAMQSVLDKVNQESIKERGRQLTPEEEQQTKDNFSMFATKHGLWEAGPEAIGNVLEIAAMFAPWKTGKLIPKNVIGKIAKGIARVGGVYGTEQATETVTQMGQQQEESKAGLTAEAPRSWTSPEDWLTSAKEVAPQTALLTTVMGGVGAGARVAKKYAGGASTTTPPPSGQPVTGELGGQPADILPPGGPTDLIPPTVPPGAPAGPTQKAPQGTPPIVNELKNALADGNITTEQADAIRQKAIITLGEDHPTVQLIDQAILDHAAKADLPPGMADGMRLAEEAQKAAGSDTVEIPELDQGELGTSPRAYGGE